MEIDWQPVTVTLSGNVINLPGSVIIPFRDWYPLPNIREMIEIENNKPESIEMCMGP